MENNSKIMLAVAVVAIVIVAGVAVVLMNGNNGNNNGGNDGVKVDVSGFADDYDNAFGDFSIDTEKSSGDTWVLISIVDQYCMDTSDDAVSSNSIKIVKYDTAEKASTAYDEVVALVATSSAMTVEIKIINESDGYDGTDADKAYLKISSRNSEKVTDTTNLNRYSQVTGAVLIDCYVIDFSQLGSRTGLSADGSRLYYGLPIEDATVADTSISVDDFESFVKLFINAFTDKDSDPLSTEMKTVGTEFANSYVGDFGPFTLSADATNSNATVSKANESDYLPKSSIEFKTTADAAKEFEDCKTKLKALTTIMDADPTEISGIVGFDGICAYKYDVTIGAMSTFTLISFAAYADDTLITSMSERLYHAGSFATDAEITMLFSQIYSVLDGEADSGVELDIKGFDDKYDSVFGDFSIDTEKTSGDTWVLTSIVDQYCMDTSDEAVSSNSIKITKYDTPVEALTAYDEAVASVATSSAMTVEIEIISDSDGYDGTDADKAYLKISSRNSEKVTDTTNLNRYSQITGAVLIDCYVIDFSQLGSRTGLSADGSRLYYGLPIEDATVADTSISVDDFENYLKEFVKAF